MFLTQVEVGHAFLPLIIIHPLIAINGLVENFGETDVFYNVGWSIAMLTVVFSGKKLVKEETSITRIITLMSILALAFLTPYIKPYTDSVQIFQSVTIFSLTIVVFPIFLVYSFISLFSRVIKVKTKGNR